MKRLLFIFSLICVLLFIGAWIIQQAENTSIYTIASYWIICILFLVVAGNYMIYRWLNKKVPWEYDAYKRIAFQLLLSGIFTVLCVNLSYYIFKSNLTELPPDTQQMILLNVYTLFIIIPVYSIFFGIFFLSKWKKATLQVEEAKKEVIQAELLSLKNHLDPHFLFNNLNILSSLIDTDNQLAQSFLEKFSEVYRYVLKNKGSEIISLSEEIEFLEAYIYLLNTRFGMQMEIELSIDPQLSKRFLPPLTIQMLMENAIKHNRFSMDEKLKIEVTSGDESLQIKNDYRPIDGMSFDLNKGTGLNNIIKRYELLKAGKPDITVCDDQFVVEIPLLKID